MSKVTMAFSDLPRELEFEILSRVPAASLAQLRSTCKRWYALFKDPSFVKKNLGKSTTTQVILKKDFKFHSVNINLHEPNIEFTGKLNSLKDSERVDISEIFVCEGLLLCTANDNRLVVWNPCTGQTRWIQIQPTPKIVKDYYALGYETNNGSFSNYKILRYYKKNPTKPMVGCEIYEFCSDSWRFIEDDDITHNWHISRIREGVSLKGNSYWVGMNDCILVKFDFKRERFESFSLPCEFRDYDFYFPGVSLSVVRQEKLYVLYQTDYMEHEGPLKMKMWVTDEANISKAKDSEIQYSLVLEFYNRRLTSSMSVISFLIDEENKMVVCFCWTGVVFFGLEGNLIHVSEQPRGVEIAQRRTGYYPIPTDYYPLLIRYVPSLVQVQQPKGKRKRYLIA